MEEGTTLHVNGQIEVKRGQVLAQSSQTVIFYTQTDGEIDLLCLDIQLDFPIRNEIPHLPDCSADYLPPPYLR